jgi:hypothetical protein
MLDKKKIGQRLKSFLYGNFKSLDEAARFLETTANSLRNSYFNGKSLPGADVLSKVMQKGCDLNWLLYGKYITPEETNPPIEYRVEGRLPAGDGESVDLSEWWESEVIDYSPDDHVFIQVDKEFGYSMMPLIAPGDLVLISFSQKARHGDLVAARWDATKGAIKILNENLSDPSLVVLTSYNQAVEPIFIKRNNVRLYKIVLIKKKK